MQQRDADTGPQRKIRFRPRGNSPSAQHLTPHILLCLFLHPQSTINLRFVNGKHPFVQKREDGRPLEEVFIHMDLHFLRLSLRGRETPAAIRFLCTSHLLQICGFAGLLIVLSIILGPPLSSLVGRKLQRSTRRRGERNLPALRSTPLRAESFLFR